MCDTNSIVFPFKQTCKYYQKYIVFKYKQYLYFSKAYKNSDMVIVGVYMLSNIKFFHFDLNFFHITLLRCKGLQWRSVLMYPHKFELVVICEICLVYICIGRGCLLSCLRLSICIYQCNTRVSPKVILFTLQISLLGSSNLHKFMQLVRNLFQL